MVSKLIHEWPACRAWNRIVFLTVLACLWGVNIHAAERNQYAGPLTIKIDLTPAEGMRLEDSLNLGISVVGTPEIQLAWDGDWDPGPDWLLTEMKNFGPDSLPAPTGTIVMWRLVCQLDPMRAGELRLPPVRLHYRDPLGERERIDRFVSDPAADEDEPNEHEERRSRGGGQTTRGEARLFEVILPTVSVASPSRTVTEADLIGPVELRGLNPVTASRLRIAMMGLSLLIVLMVLYLLFRGGIRSQPFDKTIAELEIAEQRALAAEDDAEARRRFVHEASAILRRYLERGYGLRAPRQTTPEFFAHPRTMEVLSPDQQDVLESFLELADTERFDRTPPTREQTKEIADLARSFLAGEAAGS